MNDSPHNTFMIEVEGLTKRYAGHAAIDRLTFAVRQGEIVGLLGPNGAGKSTTMRILSCYMPATSGTARVAGLDVFSESMEVRRRIGYMPENNPLHTDMRVQEYLKFRARLKGLSRVRSRDRVGIVIEQCGLRDVGRKIIGQLSMGYRQRVGLADALVHEPELIILDEPTLGLDPNQIRSVRQLIKGLGGAHTVLLSTHILPEVEMTCDQVLILHEGRILAADTPQRLQGILSEGSQVVAEIRASAADLAECWASAEQVLHYDIAAAEGDFFRCTLKARAGADLRGWVYELARANDWPLRELTRTQPSLEDVFVHMTRARGEEEER
jgi:ABC-2 type transport system ATP-binding protein